MSSKKTTTRGRPRKAIDPKVVEALAAKTLNQKEIAAALGCSVDTLQRRYADAMQRGRLKATATIRQTQFKLAVVDGNPRMLIHLGKVLCGQTGKPPPSAPHQGTDIVERIDEVRQALARRKRKMEAEE